jgi:hypothetical protein
MKEAAFDGSKHHYRIVVYATADKGDGHVMRIGAYESPEELPEIRIGMFSPDTVISFEYEKDEEEETA